MSGASFSARLAAQLPQGHTLPAELWQVRHRQLLSVLALHIPGLPIFGLFQGWSLAASAASSLPAIVFGLLALFVGSRTLRSCWCALGLLSCSAALVLLWHGTIEAHFHYFVMVAALALYEEWRVYGIAVGYVVLQHGLFAELGGGHAVFSHPMGMGMDDHSMWFWALVHGGFIALQAVANLVSWRASEDDRRRAEDALECVRHQADHDPLTGLVNRARFATELGGQLEARRAGEVVAVLFIDLDDFKTINDSLGHGAGDELLVAVAGRLKTALREEDVLARFGGDEFVAAVHAASSEVPEHIADRLTRALEDPVQLGDQQRQVSASVGIAIADDASATAESLVRDADAAMYVAKRRGKGRAQTFDGGLRADAVDRRSASTLRDGVGFHRAQLATPAEPEAAAELDRILREGAVHAVYQPVVELDGRSIVGWEALARGPHGSSLQRPDQLFAVAAATGRTAELDWLCRTAAIRGARAAGLERPHKVFVNVEPAALGSPCPDVMVTEWERAGQDLGLVAEITERALTEHPAELLRAVADFRRRGWGVALDDVGADVRSLALMPLLDPDVIKLDLRLVQAQASKDIAAIVNAVGAHRERTGAVVLAEGIETEEHLATAQAMGATFGQGWLFARPADLPPAVEMPTRPLVLHPPRLVPQNRTPYDTVTKKESPRRGDKAMLLSITRDLEREAAALGRTGVIASAFQSADRFTRRTRRRYALLADEAALVAALGVGMPARPAPGVHGGRLREDDPLRDEWSVAVLGPHFSAALVAVDRGDAGPDAERTFDFALTYDRDLVVRAMETLLVRIDTGDEALEPDALEVDEAPAV